MSCPHTETTAILAVFGEAPVDFEHHLSVCAACRSVVQEHLSTLAIVEPVVGSSVQPVAPTATRFNPYASGFLLAAAVLLGLQFSQQTPTPPLPSLDNPIHTQITPTEDLLDPFDVELAALELEIALFNMEES